MVLEGQIVNATPDVVVLVITVRISFIVALATVAVVATVATGLAIVNVVVDTIGNIVVVTSGEDGAGTIVRDVTKDRGKVDEAGDAELSNTRCGR